jgi:anhydro-N-acetylmuramic acid kinase
MSGTSLDGIDAAVCSFSQTPDGWKYHLVHTETIIYTPDWKKSLTEACRMTGRDLVIFDRAYGRYLGQISKEVLEHAGIRPDIISSHGHTVFHEPENKYTLQIGHGASLAAETGIPVVCDFRTADVAAGGQGAPLVPVGDHYLFGQYQACLNLGGFANISYLNNNQRIAYDVCPVNIVLNYVAGRAGTEFDRDGELGRKGRVIEPLLKKLNSLSYYSQQPPKSLGREWLERDLLPLLELENKGIAEIMTTLYHHIAHQLISAFRNSDLRQIYITGGGAHNNFLTDLLRKEEEFDLVIPDKVTIDYKEAIVFAFLGMLRWNEQVNCFASVTGAKKDTVCGIIYLP